MRTIELWGLGSFGLALRLPEAKPMWLYQDLFSTLLSRSVESTCWRPYVFQVRDLILKQIFGQRDVSPNFSTREIVLSVVIAVLLLASYWIFQKMIFYGINDNARVSRAGARTVAIALSTAWLFAYYGWLGAYSGIAMLVFSVLTVIVVLIYLLVVKP